ncbi:site-specific integrase [Rhodovulum sulfidophilum]|nr:site-specific integrase [Rhodovulum sulfidophilum]
MPGSPNTVASYRDTFRLLLRFATSELGRLPTDLRVGDLDAALIGRFLTSCEKERGNSARSRNTRLAAIRPFFKYVAINEPQTPAAPSLSENPGDALQTLREACRRFPSS